jgi:hypothetical protein
MTPPRDPSLPPDAPEERHATGAFRIREYTPIEPMPSPPPVPTTSATSSGDIKTPSKGFIAAISVILGIILAASAIIGGLGRAFFVSRDEFTKQETVHTTERSDLQKSLTKLEGAVSNQGVTLEKQDVSLQRLLDKVQTIREDLAARRGR